MPNNIQNENISDNLYIPHGHDKFIIHNKNYIQLRKAEHSLAKLFFTNSMMTNIMPSDRMRKQKQKKLCIIFWGENAEKSVDYAKNALDLCRSFKINKSDN